MRSCGRARDLFGPYWDDEVTQAEREWLEGHFRSCATCRTEYEGMAQALEAVASLPREEAAPDLAARALAAARRASPAPDVIFVRETPRWVPVTAAAAAVLVVVASIAPWLTRTPTTLTHGGAVPEARLVAVRASGPSANAPPAATAGVSAAAVVDSLFDHNADVDFVLDPVTPRNGRTRVASGLPAGVQGEQTVITF